MEIKTVLITQARSGSTRFPGKILKEIGGKSLLQIHLNRLKECQTISKIIVATTSKPEDEIIYNMAIKWGFDASRGAELDVLDRFYKAVKNEKPHWVVRVTSDCPLIDSKLVDNIISFVQQKNVDYGSNTLVEKFPDGQDVEVFKFSALETAWKNAKLQSEREHVTPYIRNNSDFNGGIIFRAINYPYEFDYSKIRMTVDEIRDFELIEKLIENLGVDETWLKYTNYIIDNDLGKINNSITRNEGFKISLKNDK